MMISLVSCGKKKAVDLYTDAGAKIDLTKGIDITMSIKMTEGGETETVNMALKLVKKSDNSFDLCTTITMDGESSTTMLVGGVMYAEMSGQKFKMTATDDVLESMQSMVDFADFSNIPEAEKNALGDTKVKLKDGEYTITYTLSGADVAAILQENPMFEEMDEDAFAGVSDYSSTVVIDKKGNLVSETTTFTMTEDGETSSYEVKVTFNNPGQQVTVTAPADADSYVSMD